MATDADRAASERLYEQDARWRDVGRLFNEAADLRAQARLASMRGRAKARARAAMRSTAARREREAIRLREQITGEVEGG